MLFIIVWLARVAPGRSRRGDDSGDNDGELQVRAGASSESPRGRRVLRQAAVPVFGPVQV
jgi:hypothetical protein